MKDKERNNLAFPSGNLDVLEQSLFDYNKVLFEMLLNDRTTGSNIKWGTTDYAEYGELYAEDKPILPELVTGEYASVIQPRSAKSKEAQVVDADSSPRYTFVSNHRDIVLDSALLDKLLVDAGFKTTCEIAIGDNLLSLPWVKDLVRINKSFIVERSLQPREMLLASKRLSEYMHFVIQEKNDNVWIAQREGRAKDSDDRTQPAILKMMAMGGTGTPSERLQQLHIVPLSISYEFDPCDFLKAREFQLRRDNPEWKKGKNDDVVSMQTGIMGFKGHVHYHCAPCIDEYLQQLPADTPKTEFFDIVAAHIDSEIHRNYRLYPSNYIAADMLDGTSFAKEGKYTEADRQQFEAYLQGQLNKIDLANKDIPFLRERMLTMYANPLRNKMK